MTVVVRHVAHRAAGPATDPRLSVTTCGLRFLDGGTERDREVHRPATSRCPRCWR